MLLDGKAIIPPERRATEESGQLILITVTEQRHRVDGLFTASSVLLSR